MSHRAKGNETTSSDKSLSKKIISKMAFIVSIIFLLTIMASGLLAAKSLVQANNDKLAAISYENAFLIANDIENAYGKVIGFAGSLRNISILDPKFQREAIDTALVGLLEGGDNFPTVFAYFEQNTIADANGEPYSVHKKDIAYEAVVYPNEEKTGYVCEKHEDAFDTYEKEYYREMNSFFPCSKIFSFTNNRTTIYIIAFWHRTNLIGICHYNIISYISCVFTHCRGAAKLEAGDLNIHIDISSNDELGRLAQAFNHISVTMNNYVN